MLASILSKLEIKREQSSSPSVSHQHPAFECLNLRPSPHWFIRGGSPEPSGRYQKCHTIKCKRLFLNCMSSVEFISCYLYGSHNPDFVLHETVLKTVVSSAPAQLPALDGTEESEPFQLFGQFPKVWHSL